MTLSIIVAMSANRVIGRDNTLPWRLPADLARFKQLTMGHCLLMGRKTYESIGRALPGRTTIVVTRRRDFAAPGVLVAHSWKEALRLAEGDEVFVAGGAEIYRQALPHAGRLYVTLLHAEIEGDTWFPQYEDSEWRLVVSERHEPDGKNAYPYSFLVYERT